VSRDGFETRTLQLDIHASVPLSKAVVLKVKNISTAITVVAITPLGGDTLPLNQSPVPVQELTATDISNSNALDLTDAMNKRLNGVYINENAGNPFEPDINYRGYTASPLLGTPQGLSIYLDGVRQNQPFGDVVNWDLIPKVAIKDMQLIPGSDPLFGLNTLGGAISVLTKDGISDPGVTVQMMGGYWGRASIEAQYGGSNRRGLDWFFAGNYFREDGWRKFSPSEVRQSFAKLRWVGNKTSLSLSGAYAINSLNGNGLQDFRFLNKDYTSVYTVPDTLWDHSPSLTLKATHELSRSLKFAGNAYFRHVRSDTTNGDINNDSFDQSLYNLSNADIAALKAAGYSGFPTTGNSTTQPFPYWRCIAQALEKDEPSEKCTGVITNTRTQQNNYGLSGLVSWRINHNTLAVGAAWDRSTLSYNQASQFGYLNADGITVTPVDAYADGTTEQDGEPVDTRVQLHGSINTPSLFLTDTLSLGRWSVSAAGRYNRTAVNNTDRLPAGSSHGSLAGSYIFQRLNPSIGATYRLSPAVNIYANYSEASRAPTSIELGCANPDFPCNLPNALVDDPPLNQVVSRTVEAGVRSMQQSPLAWSVGYFRGQNFNDLLFVASQQTGFGYFINFGKTKREGFELNLSGQLPNLAIGGGYTFLNATFQSSQLLNGGSNSTNDNSQAGQPGVEGNITITPGDRIPQTPQHVLKIFADYKPLSKLTIDFNVVAISGSFARGNENNRHKPDGTYYLGSGSSPAYATANLGAHYTFSNRLQLFAQMNNLADSHYSTAAQLNTTPYDDGGHFIARPFPPVGGEYPLRHTTFLAPGAPFTLFGGLKLTFHPK
jgi:outer membrane receptor protein involved in Fe transport